MLIDNFMLNVKTRFEDQDGILTENDNEDFVYEALACYGQARPLRVTDWLSGGGCEFDMPVRYDLSGSIISVGYMVGEELVYLENHDWMVYRNCNGIKLRLLRHVMLSSETIRVMFLSPYDKSELSLVPAVDLEAFSTWPGH